MKRSDDGKLRFRTPRGEVLDDIGRAVRPTAPRRSVTEDLSSPLHPDQVDMPPVWGGMPIDYDLAVSAVVNR